MTRSACLFRQWGVSFEFRSAGVEDEDAYASNLRVGILQIDGILCFRQNTRTLPT